MRSNVGNESDELESLHRYEYEDAPKIQKEDQDFRYQRHRKILNELKNVPCVDCGGKYPPYVMDFDHVRGEKVNSISQMCLYSWETIELEINKCEVVCANCHRARTHQRIIDKTKSM